MSAAADPGPSCSTALQYCAEVGSCVRDCAAVSLLSKAPGRCQNDLLGCQSSVEQDARVIQVCCWIGRGPVCDESRLVLISEEHGGPQGHTAGCQRFCCTVCVVSWVLVSDLWLRLCSGLIVQQQQLRLVSLACRTAPVPGTQEPGHHPFGAAAWQVCVQCYVCAQVSRDYAVAHMMHHRYVLGV
jgi:hypothetical protein